MPGRGLETSAGSVFGVQYVMNMYVIVVKLCNIEGYDVVLV